MPLSYSPSLAPSLSTTGKDPATCSTGYFAPSRWTVLTLRVALKNEGLSSNGNKEILLARYEAHCTNKGRVASAAQPASPSVTLPGMSVGRGDASSGQELTETSGADVPGTVATAGVWGGAPRGDPLMGDRSRCATTELKEANGETGGEVTVQDAAGGQASVARGDGIYDRIAGPSRQAPTFTKHEYGRLSHVLAEPATAEALVASKGRLTRQQQDARVKRDAAWVSTIAVEFNKLKIFTPPACVKDSRINPNAHFHHRPGEKLKAKFHEVSMKWPTL